MEHAAMQKAIAESEEMFNRAHEEEKVHSLGELIGHLRSKEMKFWNIIEKDEMLVIIHIVDVEAPWLKYSVCVKVDMNVTLHVMKTAVKKLGANLVVPEIADSKKGIVELLEGIEKWNGDLISNSVEEICEAICLLLDQLSTFLAEDDADSLGFLRQQVSLFQAKNQRRGYSADFVVFCCILFTISPHAYAYVRSHGSVTLPHPMTIRSVCSSYGMSPQQENQSKAFLSYMREDFLTSKITSASSPLKCKFKEVAHIVPVHRLDAELLHKMLKDVICGLEKIGYRVVCVVSENNSVNRKAMSHFESPASNRTVYQHPSDPAMPLFFVIDPVHILKCIRNNCINQKNDQVCFYFPHFRQL
ncbi:uncharacterized protein LOC115308222 [Ixodes scapularis]|uniref:uncharacterized protein LOC115308222 n=1 Tax=Ixodes scapularis TaxID=6945 RepID=UPI001A9D64B3|nr:uncharacterized protein LOC115308222 [Ixodes scapularis]